MIDRWDKKYKKIACELLQQLASKKINTEEAIHILKLMESEIIRSCNDFPLASESNPH